MKRPGFLRKLWIDQQANVSVVFSLAAIPLIGVAGLSIDMARIDHAMSRVQTVADGAALAAATAKGTDSAREAVGQSYAKANLGNLYGVTTIPTVTVEGNEATVLIATTVEGTLLKLAFLPLADGKPNRANIAFTVNSGASSVPGEGSYRCILALNASMADAVYVRGTGNFTAANCAVHADSSSSSAIHFQGNASATAKAFTTAGGWSKTGGAGSYSPEPEAKQAVSGDPLKLSVTVPSGTASDVSVKKQNGNVSLAQAKYNNITLQAQGTATFTAGVHYITGTLSLGSQSVLTATAGVTLVLGNNAKIDMSSGSTLKLHAPKTGTYAGFAEVQDQSASPTGVNSVQGGAGSEIRGIWYTPKQKLYITGNGDFNSNSQYSPVIIDNIEIGGNGTFTVRNDWTAYGYDEPVKLYHSNARSSRLTN